MTAFIGFTDYKVHIKDRRLNQMIENDPTILDEAEEMAIAAVKDALFVRYDTDAIFSATGTSRASQVLRWCICITLYYVYERIPDSLIPQRIVDEYERTLDMLSQIEDAKKSVDLPRIQEEDEDVTKLLWGSQPTRHHRIDGP